MAPTDRYRTLADLPGTIPLFPLRGAILLPRAELPLNIFEPRYLAMIDDAISSHRIIGIIQPEQSNAPGESPIGKAVPVKRIGCAGRITAYRELHDGRLRIALSGVARFQIAQELESDKPYRVFDVDYAPYAADLTADASAETIDRARLVHVLKAFLALRQLDTDWSAVDRAPLEPLVNGLSAMSPFGPEEKQALLEARDTKARADVLVALAEMAIAAGGDSGGGTVQ